MIEAAFAHLRCMSCSQPAATPLSEGETVQQATFRLRAQMGVNCPRSEASQHLCPMRAEQREMAR